MAKGLFTQGFCLLTDGQTTLADVKATLKDYDIVKQVPQQDWRFGGPSLVVAYLPEDNGYAAVDVVNRPWPDAMGDPKADAKTFAAWGMGHFGPFAFPGGLARAGEHSWAWEPGRTIAEGHRGFIRLRMSYGFGAADDAPVWPDDYDALAELLFLSRAALAVLRARGVLCYFNPNGEVLRDRPSFRQVWLECKKQEKIPLPLWMNVRFFNVNEKFCLMDTVGNGQLDLMDVEAVFPREKYDPVDVEYYLRNVALYLLGLDREMQSGEEIDGPGENDLSWTTEVVQHGASAPVRRVLRLYPKANRKAIRALAGRPRT